MSQQLFTDRLVDVIGIEDFSSAIEKREPLRVKAGFDPTSPHLHMGHVVLLTKLREMQEAGHYIYLLVGDFTALIGDPSGRSKMRPALTLKELQENMETYESQVGQVLDRKKLNVVRNSDWLGKLSSQELIALCSQYSLARMLERDDFSNRYKSQSSIALHEFIYPLLQGYDSVVLKAEVELGGTDQLFNLLVGRELQKNANQKPQMVLTMPILEGLDGVQKMSKSLGNAIHLSDSAEDIFGKVMSISDPLMWRYYELLSSKKSSDLKCLQEDVSQKKLSPRDAKANLARELTIRFCGPSAAHRAEEDFKNRFQKQGVPDNLERRSLLLESTLIPRIVMVLKLIGLSDSLAEATRMIAQGAVRLDGLRILDPNQVLSWKREMVLQVGRRKFARVYLDFIS